MEWTESELKNIFEKVMEWKKTRHGWKWRNFNLPCSCNLLNGILKRTGFSNFIWAHCEIIIAGCFSSLGPDTGWDSIGDFPQAQGSLCISEFPG